MLLRHLRHDQEFVFGPLDGKEIRIARNLHVQNIHRKMLVDACQFMPLTRAVVGLDVRLLVSANCNESTVNFLFMSWVRLFATEAT